MEEQVNPDATNELDQTPIQLPAGAYTYLDETRRWAYFLGIVGFVLSGLIALMGLFSGTFMQMMSGGQMPSMRSGMGVVFGIVYFLLGLLYFFPSLYLFNYGKKLKAGLENRDDNALLAAFSNEKSFFKFCGILMAVFIGIYALMALFGLLTALIF